MNSPPDWPDGNARHLEAEIARVRRRLVRAAEGLAARPAGADPPASAARSLWSRGAGMARASTSPAPPPHSRPNSDLAEDHEAADRIEAEMEEPPALSALAHRLGLTPFERDVVLLCAAMELDTRVAALCARAQDDPARPYPTFALALGLFDEPEWSALTPDRPLRASRLLEIHQPATTPLTAASLRIDERIVHYLKGINSLDDRLSGLVAPLRGGGDAAELPRSQEAVARGVISAWREASRLGEPFPTIALTGDNLEGKRLVAEAAARAVGVTPFRLGAEWLPHDPTEVEALARLWQREALLLPLALYVDAEEAGGRPADLQAGGLVTSPAPGPIDRFLARVDGLVFVAAREPGPRNGRPSLAFDVAKPTTAEQVAAWRSALGPDSEQAAHRLAGHFHLNLPSIARAGRSAHAALPSDAPADALGEAAWERCRSESRPRVEGLAERIEPRASWADLILPPEPAALLRRIASHVRHRATVFGAWGFDRLMTRGLGLCALFCGPSGTGKTMAAEVLAHDLRLDLFRIDLASVVSKYIGETEKNLRRLFDGFEESGAILFFDEADSLFGKRSEVRDSHDRYANIEVNYLLQRIETYRGLAILATNQRSALDPAFLRRLRFVIEFPTPTAAERKHIWSGAFPRAVGPSGLGGVPTENLDAEHLAWLDLTGGHIRNAALSAAFRAAESGGPVTMADVLASARDEYVKLERTIHEAEFRPSATGRKEGAA